MIRIFSQYVSPKALLLIMLEGILILLSLVCAVKLRFWSDVLGFQTYTELPTFGVQCAVVVLVCLGCLYFNDLYNFRPEYDSLEKVLRIEQSLGAASLLLGLLYFVFPSLLLGRGVFIISMVLVTTFIALNRKLIDKAWQLTANVQRVIILGTGELAVDLARELSSRRDLSVKLEGFVRGGTGSCVGDKIVGFPVLGVATEMETITKERGIARIIVALEDRRGALPTRELVALRVQGVQVDDASSALAALTGRVWLRAVKPSWFVFSDGFHRSKWNDFVKRVVDLAGAILGLVVSMPIMALVALIVRFDSKGPIIYRQVRVGRMGKCFEVLKFRSMRVDAEKETGAQWASENDPRATRVGKFLRKYRLDELPQFLNVIIGDMSFVGPRPERPCFVEELRKTIPYYDERHSVRPGLTGWAQVQYRYGASVEDSFNKLEYDLFYLKQMSLTFDVAIIFQTIRIMLCGQGAR